jgi:hypothetical protein
MNSPATVFVPDQARTASSPTQQERDQLRRELLRRIIASESRRQSLRITPH